MNKASVRQQLRAQRSALTPQQQRAAAQALAQKLRVHPLMAPLVQQAKVIALYSPNDGEIDPTGLMHLVPGKTWAFPRVESVAERRMRFYPVNDVAQLRPGAYGIAEPMLINEGILPVDECIELVITPLVAFDRLGNRLGMGGGYYDRFFQKHPKALRIGVAHAFQQVEALAAEAWDKTLDYCLTDQGLAFPAKKRCPDRETE